MENKLPFLILFHTRNLLQATSVLEKKTKESQDRPPRVTRAYVSTEKENISFYRLTLEDCFATVRGDSIGDRVIGKVHAGNREGSRSLEVNKTVSESTDSKTPPFVIVKGTKRA